MPLNFAEQTLPHGRRLAVSDPEYNAARRAEGLRAVAQGLNINLDLEVAIVCLNHAADKIEELERERDSVQSKLSEATEEIEELQEQLNAYIMLDKMAMRKFMREREEERQGQCRQSPTINE